MTQQHHQSIQLIERKGEMRVQDTEPADRLDYDQPRQIRELIKRHTTELRSYGGLSYRTTNPSEAGGRPGRAYFLNEGQALLLCCLSRTDKAAEVRNAVAREFGVNPRTLVRTSKMMGPLKARSMGFYISVVMFGFTADAASYGWQVDRTTVIYGVGRFAEMSTQDPVLARTAARLAMGIMTEHAKHNPKQRQRG